MLVIDFYGWRNIKIRECLLFQMYSHHKYIPCYCEAINEKMSKEKYDFFYFEYQVTMMSIRSLAMRIIYVSETVSKPTQLLDAVD